MVDNCAGVQELPDSRRIFSGDAENHIEKLFQAKRLADERADGHVSGFFLGIPNRNRFRQRHRGRIRGEWPKSR
jgi:hypothetical protein